MDINLGLLSHSPANNAGAGDGVPSDGSNSEVTSSYSVFDENLELGLGLSIGGCCKTKNWTRILTAKDLKHNNTCSSSNSSNCGIGIKRSANDSSHVSVSPPNSTSVVGWPPVSKAHRMPNLVNQVKSTTENLITEQNKSKNRIVGINDYSSERKVVSNKKYQSVKVNLDGTQIGRKVDLNAHTSYEMLAHTLEEMFWGKQAAGHSRLLDGTSEFVLTYEDKDGDCMLVGDVPWQMFLSSVKRLRIIRNSESNELSSKQQETQN